MSKSTLAAEIVRRLPDLIKDSPSNAETVIRGMLDELELDIYKGPCPEPPAIESEKSAYQQMYDDTNPRTLRDEFAAAALNGLLSNHNSVDFKWGESDIKAIYAKTSYEYAAAMMEARKK